MKKESLVQQALENVPGFMQSYTLFCDKLLIWQKAPSTIGHYVRSVAGLSLYYGRLPEDVTDTEIDGYLAHRLRAGASYSVFKHIVCGLRSYFRSIGQERSAKSLPKIPQRKSLPQVLSQQECIRLFKAPKNLKSRVLLSFVYSAGLRSAEALNLRMEDVDMDRMMIHVRNSKGNKDRYIPLSHLMLRGLQSYIGQYAPQTYLFNGRLPGKPLSPQAAQNIMRESVLDAQISKHATLHTLRHSYATHLLDMGINIRQLMALMGHSDIESTLIYVHLTNPVPVQAFSPFDFLYSIRDAAST